MSRAEHLATLGELATGLAHEIRNPLAGIAGVIEIVGRDLPVIEPGARGGQRCSAGNRADQPHLYRSFGNRPAHPPESGPSNLNTTVEHAVMLARQQVLSKPIKIELQKAPDLAEVEHDSDQIHQVLLNLLLNAVQAIEGAGTVRVEIGAREDCASVVVSDTGRGISRSSSDYLPALLHHQRQWHRPRPFAGPAHRGRTSWPHRSDELASAGKGAVRSVLVPFHTQLPCVPHAF